jgi:thiamine-monophosphate kinase
VPAGQQLVVTTDVLVSGVHFLPTVDPAALGHKSLAVNLSDLAAMGAEPAWFTLNLVLPSVEESWLARFCEGMYALARRYDVQLVGGDTSRGPLAIAIEAYGFVPRGHALTRAGARPGDRIFVTGTLGDAGLALAHELGRRALPDTEYAVVRERLERPIPRIEEGLWLRSIASAAIDISDGLAADLGHILESSGVGAQIALERLPLSAVYRAHLAEAGWDPALANGDDYELCFTVPVPLLADFEHVREQLPAGATEIGEVVVEPGLHIRQANGTPYRPRSAGHDHFAEFPSPSGRGPG